MENVLGSVGYWVGLNYHALWQGAVGALFVGAIAVFVWRKHHIRAWLAATIAFFFIFGFVTARLTAGQVYLLTEDNGTAIRAQLGVLAVTVGVMALLVTLRTRPRIVASTGFVALVVLGTSMPTAAALFTRTRWAPVEQQPSANQVPEEYPSVPIWMNQEEGFGARFPDVPKRVGVAGLEAQGYTYQSIFSFEDGRAVANVAITGLPFSLDSKSQRTFLAETHRTFLQSIGASPESSQVQWSLFGNGAPILQYKTWFVHDGLEFVGKGFWLVDRRRAFRVAVTYPRGISTRSAAIVEYFPNTFVLAGDSSATVVR